MLNKVSKMDRKITDSHTKDTGPRLTASWQQKEQKSNCQKGTNEALKIERFEGTERHFICGAERALQKWLVLSCWPWPSYFFENFGDDLN